MSPESTHKLMGFHMEVLILGVSYILVHGFCFFKLFPSYRVYSVKTGLLCVSMFAAPLRCDPTN